MVTGSSWTTAGTLGVAFVGMSNVLGPRRGDRRRRGHLRRLLRRQDDAAVGDHDPGAEAGRRRADRRAARAQHDLDGRPGARHQPGHLLLPRAAPPTPTPRSAPTQAAGSPGGGVQHLRAQPAAPRCCWSCSRSCKMPPFLSILGSALFAGGPRAVPAVGRVVAFVDDPSLGHGRDRHEGGLRRDGDRLREQLRRRRRSTTCSPAAAWPACSPRSGWSSGALSFAAVMEHAGFLQRLLEPIVTRDPPARLADRRGQRQRHRPQRDRR